MTKKSVNDFWIWLFWLTITIGTLIFGLIYINTNSNSNYYSDKTRITIIIVTLFIFALIKNTVNTISIFYEFRNLENSEGLFQKHRKNLENITQRKLSISQDFSLLIIENELLRKESWTQLFSNLLITLGMIGTVVGLTLSMQGLSQAMNSVNTAVSEGNFTNNSAIGLEQALQGMSSAFITTLVGAVLGGLFLKVLNHSTTNLIEHLIDRIRYKTEIEVIPNLQNEIWTRDVDSLSGAYKNMKEFINSSDSIDRSLRKYNQQMYEAADNLSNITLNLRQELSSLERDSQIKTQERIEKLLNQLIKVIGSFNKLVTILTSFLFLAILITVGILIF